MRFWPRSLYWRLLAGTALWTTVALVVSAIVLTGAFRVSAERGFRNLLAAHSYNVMGALSRNEEGRLTGGPDLRDPRFLSPLSGWSWAAFDDRDRIASRSLARATLIVPDVPYDETFQRAVTIEDAMGKRLLVLEAQLLIDDDERPVTVQVAGATAGIDAQIADFRETLVWFFGLFGLGLIAVTALVLRVGLRPLDRVREQLAAVRDGGRETLGGNQPREIQPLVDEVNALLASNRPVVERARNQVGNLAHAVKTPLTVLANEARSVDGPLARLVAEQVDRMRGQIDAYLDRARIAALRHSARARTPVAPVADAIVRTVGRLAPQVDVALADPVDPALAFAGDASDLEELFGNLVENAARFASGKVRVAVTEGEDAFDVTVDDDGPGLSPEEMTRATGRGVRLDERRSGSGLGLAIVSEIAEAYDGALTLERSPLGGLRARLTLPYAGSRKDAR